MRNKILSLLVLLLTAASGAWAQDQLQTEYTSNATLNNVTVSADMEIAIGDGAVVTINNGLTIAEGKTLTVNGPGKLVVKGTNGSQGSQGKMRTGTPGGQGTDGSAAITGNIVIKGATVEANGGYGGQGGTGGSGTDGSNPGQGGKGGKGGKGGAAFTGAVTIFSGTITARGGSGGDGGSGGEGGTNPMDLDNRGSEGDKGEGGDGGNAFAGMLTFYGGTVKADGARCGYGKPDGNTAKAFANDVTMNAATYELRGSNTGNNTAIELADIVNYRYVDITAADAKDPNDLNVEPVDGQDNTWTFAMPASNVVLTPQYAPTAAWATTGSGSEVTTLLPAAAEGVIAGTDAPLIVEGTGIVAFAGTSTEVTQGTVMYAVTAATATEAPAFTAFSADVPTAKDIADDGADVLVWYYIQGADTPDGQQATADNTFNNSEVSSLTVSVRSNKFDLALKAANANTIEAGKATVTVGGTAATVTEGKLQGVKMGSEVKMTAAQGYKFRKVEVKKTGSAVLAPALENGATVVIICNWGYGTTTFTYTNNGGTFSGQSSGYEAEYFHNGLELNGKNLSFSASNMDNSEYLSVGITFNTESSAYSYTGKGQDFVSFTISVNGTDVTSQLSELK